MVTLAGIAVPVRVLAAAGTVIFAVPSKRTPLIVLAVSNLVDVLELPLILRPIISLASIILKKLVPVAVTTLPERFPINSAVILLAEKSPALSLATTLPIILFGVASTLQVRSVDPSKLDPIKYEPLTKLLVVLAFTVIFVLPLNGTLLIVM